MRKFLTLVCEHARCCACSAHNEVPVCKNMLGWLGRSSLQQNKKNAFTFYFGNIDVTRGFEQERRHILLRDESRCGPFVEECVIRDRIEKPPPARTGT